MKTVIILLGVASLVFSCSESDNPDPTQVERISSLYLIDKENHSAYKSTGGEALFEYRKGKVVKRSGGFLGVASAGGWGGAYVKEIYDTVQYFNNETIKIYTRDNLDGVQIAPYEREITVKNGLVKRKITATEITAGLNADTIYYFYDSQNRIKRTEQYIRWNIITRDYFFDDNGNLQRITGVVKDREYEDLVYTTEETFDGYDDKPNPLKGLCLWPDLYYRSLSVNNFTKYAYKSGTTFETKTWNLVYDTNGNVDYSKP